MVVRWAPPKQPSAAQRSIADFALKSVELTDDLLFGDVRFAGSQRA